MANIKQIQVGTLPYDIAALTIRNGDTEKTWADIEALVTAGFTIEAPWTSTDYTSTTAPTAAKLATVPAVTVYYNNGKSTAVGTLAATGKETRKHIYLVYHPHGDKDSFDEYISTGTVWEKIGNTDIDLSDYAKKGTYTSTDAGAGNTGSAGAATITSSSAGAQTATGTATVTYKKADVATGSAGAGSNANTGTAGAISYSPTFHGTAATITVESESATIDDHTYQPAGSVSVTPVAASTISINHVTGAALAATPTFTGTEGDVSVSGSYKPAGTINVVVDDHSYKPEGTVSVTVNDASYKPAGTISGSQTVSAHSHTVNLAKSTVTYVSGTATGSAGEHSHEIDSHAHAADVTAVGSLATKNVYEMTGVGSLPTITIAAADTGSAVTNWEVVSGVLKLITGTFVTGANKVSGWNAGSLPSRASVSVVYGASTTVTAAGASSAATLTSKAAGAHTHSLTTATFNNVTGATLSTAGGVTINGSNFAFNGTTATLSHTASGSFAGTTATISHNVSTKSFTGTTATITLTGKYTPVGTISKPAINLTSSAKTVAIEGIKSVSAAFTGTTATLAHSFTDSTVSASMSGAYTPAGTIDSLSVAAHSHSYTKPAAHTHSIGLTDTTITAPVSVAVADHTHTVTVASHTHSIGNHNHKTTI